MHQIARVCAYLIDYGTPLIADLRDEHLALVPCPNAKPPGWIIGHLVVSGDFLRRQRHQQPLAPREWGPRFGPESEVPAAAADYPSMDCLRATFLEGYRDLVVLAPTIAADLLDAPNPFEAARAPFPALRDFGVYLMTAHVGYHLGQLAGWRVAAGLPPRAGPP
ncbi:MAG: DinB family protein [Gemmatimonadota bacterium]|nr:DinB family protein [Gemmatimonadota bacterium]